MSGECSSHKPVQHRDARQPWCNTCGLDKDGNLPVTRFRFGYSGTGNPPDSPPEGTSATSRGRI